MTNATIDTARAALGPVGVFLPATFTETPAVDTQRAAVRRLERAGYRAAWTNEVLGKDALVQLAVLLAATQRMTFGTGVANIWTREPQTLHGGAALLAQAYPGRIVVGIGVGYPQQAADTGREYGRPLATLEDYRGRMDRQTWPPALDAAYPRIFAANGPGMIALAGRRADGALPAGLPPEFTAQARQALGPDKLLVVGLSVVGDPDPDQARRVARQTATTSLGRPAYAANIARLGYSESDIADVSDRLVDAVVAHGDPDAIASTVGKHLAAGADHVMVMPTPAGDFAAGIDQLERLAPALTALG